MKHFYIIWNIEMYAVPSIMFFVLNGAPQLHDAIDIAINIQFMVMICPFVATLCYAAFAIVKKGRKNIIFHLVGLSRTPGYRLVVMN